MQVVVHVRIVPEIVACAYPVEQDERCDAPKERRDAAEAIADVAYQATLWPDVLYFAKLERLLACTFHAAAGTGVLLLWFDAKQCDAGDTKTKRIEKQYYKRVTQFVKHHPWRI